MMAAIAPDTFIDNAKVMAKGQVTIPKDVRTVLGLDNGSRVTFIVEKGSVRMVNSAVYAMQMLRDEMAGEAEKSGLTSCMLMIGTCHIGEVQASIWDPETVRVCKEAGVMLL